MEKTRPPILAERDPAHHQEIHALLRVGLINCGEVGVSELGNSLCFFATALTEEFVDRKTEKENSSGCFAIEVFIVGPVNFSRATDISFLANAEVAPNLASNRILTDGVIRHGERRPFPLHPLRQIVGPAKRLVNRNITQNKPTAMLEPDRIRKATSCLHTPRAHWRVVSPSSTAAGNEYGQRRS